ncbi:UDP-glucoronosyl and UDP-glucosyl transferase [Ostertagia ostertagi]
MFIVLEHSPYPNVKELAGKKLIERCRSKATMFCRLLARATLEQKQFLRWLEAEHFDLAFTHMFDVCTIGLVHNAKIPSWIWLNRTSNKAIYGYHRCVTMFMEKAGEMNFIERTKSFIGHGLMKLLWRRMVADPETEVFRRLISPDFPDLLDLAAKCPVVMANTNDLYEIPRPTLAKVVNIGGLGMESRDVKPLPKVSGEFFFTLLHKLHFRSVIQNIEEIMGRGDGAIVLSFGSVAVAYRMPMEWKMVFLETFKRFPNYQFLVRYESDDIRGNLSSNVHLFKWFPQTDILNHPRTKALITHGGYNSFQPKNARLAEHHGFGLVLHKAELTVSALSAAIQEVLTNPEVQKTSRTAVTNDQASTG